MYVIMNYVNYNYIVLLYEPSEDLVYTGDGEIKKKFFFFF